MSKAKKLRICLFAVCVFMAWWFCLPAVFSGIVNEGNLAGIAFFSVTAVLLAFYPKISAFLKSGRHKGIKRAAAVLVTVCYAAVLLTAAVTGAMIVSAACDRPTDGPHTVIVLGCQVNPSGPSKMLWQRINAAEAYLTAHPDAYAILSGGQGENEPVTEAECMYRELVERGIDPGRLIREDRSVNTEENLKFSKRIIDEKGLPESVVLISNNYHLCRARMYARRQGIDCSSVPAKTDIWVLPTFVLREMGGVVLESVGIHR